ncbi:MAG: helix-turn-helix transcriptional regulator [Candidatus Omnitrophota bacterium]|jgi:transcriptional regulator with XRE-family HTH domain
MKDLILSELNNGVTQRDLANKIHVSQGTIQKILFTETKFTHETRKKVADYFRVPVSDFYDDGQPPGQTEPVTAPENKTDDRTYALLMRLVEEQSKRIDTLEYCPLFYAFYTRTSAALTASRSPAVTK